MLRPALFAAVSVALLAPQVAHARAGLQSQAPVSYQVKGRYKLVSGTTLTQGIEQATEDLPMFERMYARHRLADVNPLYKTIQLNTGDCGLELKFDERSPMCLKEGQDLDWTREDGEKFAVSLQAKGRRFIQTYKGKDGQRTNTFFVAGSGNIVIMDVLVRSHKLKKTLRYQLVY